MRSPPTLRRKLFTWFGVAIIASLAASGAVSAILTRVDPSPWKTSVHRVERYFGRQFAEVWERPEDRAALAEELAEELNLRLELVDVSGRVTEQFRGACGRRGWTVPVRAETQMLGSVNVCMEDTHAGGALRFFAILAVMALVFWAAAGRMARRISRPLSSVASVAEALGEGRLEARATVCRSAVREVGVLAAAINDMAERIDRQIKEQKELLAAVSHELRTPLGHLRLLVELAEQRRTDPNKVSDALQKMDREVKELDGLVGELLAKSRLDFSALDRRTLDAREVVREALERAGLSDALLEMTGPATVQADPTLIGRALANLLENGQRHGNGVRRVLVNESSSEVRFVVDDDGPGIGEVDPSSLLRPLVQGDSGRGHLGLGLALVQRIAQAHGGRAALENRPEGGARASISLPKA